MTAQDPTGARSGATDWRLRFAPGDEDAARALAFNGGRYPQGEPYRLLRLALHEIDCLREDYDALLVSDNEATIRHGLAIKHLIEAGGDHHARFLAEPPVAALLERDRFDTRRAEADRGR